MFVREAGGATRGTLLRDEISAGGRGLPKGRSENQTAEEKREKDDRWRWQRKRERKQEGIKRERERDFFRRRKTEKTD